MFRARRSLLAAVTTTAPIAVWSRCSSRLPWAPPSRAVTTCLGRPVTVVACSTSRRAPRATTWSPSPRALEHVRRSRRDDTIASPCRPRSAGSDPWPPTSWWRPVPGTTPSSTVRGRRRSPVNVGLGAGDDSFTGNGLSERVFADTLTQLYDGAVPAVTHRDVIATGACADTVSTAAAEGQLTSTASSSVRARQRSTTAAPWDPRACSTSAPRPPPGSRCRCQARLSPVAVGVLVVDTSRAGRRLPAPRCSGGPGRSTPSSSAVTPRPRRACPCRSSGPMPTRG